MTTSLEPSTSAAPLSSRERGFDPRALEEAIPLVEQFAGSERMRRKVHRWLAGGTAAVVGFFGLVGSGGNVLGAVTAGAFAGAFIWLLSWPIFAFIGAITRASFSSNCRDLGLRSDILVDAVLLLAKERASGPEGAVRAAASGRSLRA